MKYKKLSKKQFYNLRKQIILNSLFLRDYDNDMYITPRNVCAFMDGAVEYINNEYKEKHGRDIDIYKIKTSQLYNYYKFLEFDPLWRDDYIAYSADGYGCAVVIYNFVYGIEDRAVAGSIITDDICGGAITTSPREYKIYYNSRGGAFIVINKKRYYLNNFIRRELMK